MREFYYNANLLPLMTSPEVSWAAFDRTRTVFDIKEVEVLQPIGTLCTPKTIAELSYDRIRQIDLLSEGRDLYVMWSGGIDSTLALTEALKVISRDRINVILNEASIREYPLFYEKYIKGQLLTHPISFRNDDCIRDALRSNGVIVTGGCLDHIFGSNSFGSLKNPTRKILPHLKQLYVSGELTSHSMESWDSLIQACPRNIETEKEFFWWLSYVFDYQHEQLMFLFFTPELVLEENIFHFGDTPAWNDYAVSIPMEEKFPGTALENYKMPLKRHIELFTHDDLYTIGKIKVRSWRRHRTPLERTTQKCKYIKTDWSRG